MRDLVLGKSFFNQVGDLGNATRKASRGSLDDGVALIGRVIALAPEALRAPLTPREIVTVEQHDNDTSREGRGRLSWQSGRMAALRGEPGWPGWVRED